jgi:hypothetical protein
MFTMFGGQTAAQIHSVGLRLTVKPSTLLICNRDGERPPFPLA